MARLIIAGMSSGVGKTTITVGLIAALRRRGLSVQPFKVGPDYIDPTYHALAAGRPCRNLDAWMVPPDRAACLVSRATRDVDVAVIEGVMGLFDGFGYDDDAGSTAAASKLLNAPVVLVVDASKMARSAGAIALGFRRFDPDLNLAGFIVNRVGGDGHGRGVASAIEQRNGLAGLRLAAPRPAAGNPRAVPGPRPDARARPVDRLHRCRRRDRRQVTSILTGSSRSREHAATDVRAALARRRSIRPNRTRMVTVR